MSAFEEKEVSAIEIMYIETEAWPQINDMYHLSQVLTFQVSYPIQEIQSLTRI